MKNILVLLLCAFASSAVAEEDPRPAQFRIWGTMAPSATERIIPPPPYQEALPAGFDPGFPLDASPALIARGFIPFRHHPQALMHPRLQPGPAELADAAMEGFSSRGEYTSLCLGLHALREIDVSASLSGDLHGPSGSRLPASNVEVRWVKFLPNPVARFVYRLDPMLLERRTSRAVQAGESAFLWITVYVPPDTKDGVYRGSVVMSAPNLPRQHVPIVFRVVDVALERPDRHFAMLYHFSRRGVAAGDFTRLDDEFADMALHGMNSLSYIQLSPGEVVASDGSIAFDAASPSGRIGVDHRLSVRRILDAARSAGLDRDAVINLAMIYKYSRLWTGREWGTEECDAYLRRLASAWGEEDRRLSGRPRIMLNIGDEPTSQNGRLEPARRLGGLMREGAPTLMTTCFCVGGYIGESDLSVLGSLLDVPVVPVLPTAAYRDLLAKREKPFWLYNSARPERPLEARMAFGWQVLSTGADGMEQFMYRQVFGCDPERLWESAFLRWPANGFDDLEPAWCYAWRVDDGCLPSPAFESIRSGIADLRYFQTAFRAAQRASEDVRPDVREAGIRAQARLDELKREFSYFLPGGAFRGLDWPHAVGTEILDHRRWELARLILSLRDCGGAAIDRIGENPRLSVTEMATRPPMVRSRSGGRTAVIGLGSASSAFIDEFSLLGSASIPAAGRKKPTYSTSAVIVARREGLAIAVSAEEPDGTRPRRMAGGMWGQDGVEVFLSSPRQDGLIYQVVASSLGDVGMLAHKRIDAERCEEFASFVETPPRGLIASGTRSAKGWNLDIFIPWESMGLPSVPAAGEVWGFNICRTRRGESATSASERSSWSPLESRFLEAPRLGRLAIGADPGWSADWGEVVGDSRCAFAVLSVDNRGPATAAALSLEGKVSRFAISVGRSRLSIPIPDPTRERKIEIRREDDVVVSTLELCNAKAAMLEVAGVGSKVVSSAAGRVLRPVVTMPGSVWSHARSVPVAFDIPMEMSGAPAVVEVKNGGRSLLKQEMKLPSSAGFFLLANEGTFSEGPLDVRLGIDGLVFSAESRVVTGFVGQ